ncbi:3-deoxy-D-manno-octulosonic acid transferase [Terrimonas sp. NA20]|uniref:3-deoxy-D-manno-octulosonic acid transferase n=1 Tax=Terrimonas ginsenosidimutans TaxID=2908004 RepID=A0ABS9KUA8_9BACT|nr:glycosyltransferase N-terminal domain-containing protein [Terrimonas ginsenosidimutans]MCG2615885.1 3-deoxy-D-manno-octulosonic acid transferase [Terrimonas ginsenosidimutans]
MKLIFYNIFLFLFSIGVRIAAFFNKKAGLWIEGRKDIFERLNTALQGQSHIVWMHCASLGEFEQGRPVLEKIRQQYPSYKLLVTFFSPSGYETMKNYKGADWIFYLPMDGRSNAKRFLEIVNPSLVVFVKYEYWYYYLNTVQQRNIPLLMVSAIFRENAAFFKWYGGLHRKMLNSFTHLFIQTEESLRLLSALLPADRFTLAGDTRFDRVIDIAEKAEPIPLIEQFTAHSKTIIAGSSWPPDEAILQTAFNTMKGTFKLIIAPHQVDEEHISQIRGLFPGCLLYSQLLSGERQPTESNVLIINNIGLLSRIYRYAHTTYIGGAFGAGLHNTLEAAVYGKPVVFGTVYRKFNEAIGLVETGAAFSIANADSYISILQQLVADEEYYEKTCSAARGYVFQHKGATARIMHYIQEKRLLTS